MTAHAEYTLRRPRISQILDLLLAIATSKAGATKRLVSGKNREVLDLVAARIAAVGAVVADE